MDESGTFSPVADGTHSVSVVGALVVPDQAMPRLLARYERLRQNLPRNRAGEVKGKLLDEKAIAKVLDLLFKNNCIFEAVAIDMGLESAADLEAHRTGQAHYLVKDLTERHHPKLVAQTWDLRKRLERMAIPLYVQSIVAISVISKVIEHAPLYYSQRAPKELSDFHWVIDGKEVGKVTNAEDWWSTCMCPFLQSNSATNPMPQLEGADYSYFDQKYERKTPPHLIDRFGGDKTGINLNRLMLDSFRFSSEPEAGLELGDIVTNATRRAMSGNLGIDGWWGIPRMMIHRSEQYVGLVTLRPGSFRRAGAPYEKVLMRGFRANGRSMLTRSVLDEADQ